MTAYSVPSTIWGTGENSEDVPGLAATADVFDVLGVRPLLGRGFSQDDEKPGAARVVVITYEFWQRHFAGDPKIIGTQATMAGHVHTITGVMPRGWKFPVQRAAVNYITPLAPLFSSGSTDYFTRRGAHFLYVAGRLKDGVDLREATADLKTIAAQLANAIPRLQRRTHRTRRRSAIGCGR